jgi:hypothetical protein|tara:strand:- start:59 stop:238 length:180 start_codon:yes stop_codon:yes gene_type:complete
LLGLLFDQARVDPLAGGKHGGRFYLVHQTLVLGVDVSLSFRLHVPTHDVVHLCFVVRVP